MSPSLPPTFTDVGRTALLIYDMQRGIVKQIPDASRVTAACKVALDAARRVGMRVAYTKHMSPPRAWLGATQLRTAMAWQRVQRPEDVKLWFPRGSDASDLTPELAPHEDDLVIEKFSMSALTGTSLPFALSDCGIVNLVIVGIALEIGIEPTVRAATDLGFVPIVLTDACGWGNKAAADRAFETMRFVGEAILTDTNNFVSSLASIK